MKERPPATPMAVRHSTADERMRRQEPIRPEKARSRILLALIPAAFCALATLLSGLLLYYYLPNGPWRSQSRASEPLQVPKAKQDQESHNPGQESGSQPANPKPASTPPPAAASSDPSTASAPANAENPPPAAEADPVLPAVRANEVLEAFLHAKEGKARLGMVEPEASLQDLQTWEVTRGPLWEVAQVVPDMPQRLPQEQVTDYPYRVSFFIPNRKNVEFAMIVRQRGDQPPRVFLPAFLDLAGGRLANFTKEPNTQEPTAFHVVLEPVARCYEENVPDPDRKFTLKLLASTVGKETSRAYVSTGSRFKAMLDDPESPVRWGTRRRATVTLQWNHKEDPAMPYLELIDINSLGWNP